MAQWRVRQVMTTEVITASDDASVTEIAAILTANRISAVPIVDRFDAVRGVVSWTDLPDKIDVGEPDDHRRVGWRRRWARPLRRWAQRTAVQVMSAPPLSVGPDASLPAAARTMYRRGVGRLLVVDDSGRLLGIVTRSDLLKLHARLDAVIRDEVMQRVLRRTLMIEPGTVQATVEDGVATLTGHTTRKSTALAAAALTEAVTGVTAVRERLTFDLDDTGPAPNPTRPTGHDPLHGWSIRRQPANPPTTTPRGHQPTHHATRRSTDTTQRQRCEEGRRHDCRNPAAAGDQRRAAQPTPRPGPG
jgi:CBS domain-containing protein